jgi:DNA-binding transcriptional LysR family regulator
MENLNLNYLKYFYDAVNENSVGKAARLNFVSPPAVSQAIRKLGEVLNTELLVHGKNRFQLTDSGNLVFQKCRIIFASVSDMRNDLEISHKNFTGIIRFATSQSVALSLLPERMKSFKRQYPLVRPHMKLGRTALNRQWLEEGIIEFAVALDDGGFNDYERVVIKSGKFLTVEVEKKEDGPREYMIGGAYRPEVLAMSRFYEKKFKKPFPIAYEIESWEVITKFALQGLGIGLIPDYILERQTKADQNRLDHVPSPNTPYEVCAFYRKGDRITRNSQLFIEHLTK